MTEATLKGACVKALRDLLPGYVIIRHEDRWTGGIPDISVTGHARTSWWEAKHAHPDFASNGLQELTMKRLAGSGFAAHYIIWDEEPTKRTLIIHPRDFVDWKNSTGGWTVGFNHKWLAERILKLHERGDRP